MESRGLRLKKIRLEKGLSLEELQKRTKIHLNILKAIEEDSLVNIDSVYIKGFLKIYCKSLGLDPRDFIGDYHEPQAKVTIQSSYCNTQGGVAFLKAAWLKLFSLMGRIPIRLKNASRYLGIGIIIIAFFYLGKTVVLKQLALRAAKIRSTPPYSRPRSMPKKVSAAPAALRPGRIMDDSVQKSIPKENMLVGIRLAILAKEDCLVKIKGDGRLLYSGILKKGRAENWKAKDNIELYLGNAGVVTLEVNGKLISNLGRKGQVIKNISITKEGLVVGR